MCRMEIIRMVDVIRLFCDFDELACIKCLEPSHSTREAIHVAHYNFKVLWELRRGKFLRIRS